MARKDNFYKKNGRLTAFLMSDITLEVSVLMLYLARVVPFRPAWFIIFWGTIIGFPFWVLFSYRLVRWVHHQR